jgi:HEAT repeat protein
MAMNDEGQSERIEQLIGALRDDNEALRDHAIASLSQLGEEAIEPLIGLMADEDVLIREAATIAVVRMGPSVVDRLIEAMDDDEWAIREQAASGLGKLKDPRGVDPLVKALKERPPSGPSSAWVMRGPSLGWLKR